MRPPLLLLYPLFFLPRLSAQEPYFDYALSEYHARINAVDWQDGRTLAGGSTRDCDRAAIWLFDQQGNLQWMRPAFEFGYSRIGAVRFDRRGDIVVAGYRAEADDYPAPGDGWRVEKWDSLGQLQFLTPLFRQTTELDPFEAAVHLLDLPDGRYVAGAGNRLAWLSAGGDSLFSRHYGDHYCVDLDLIGDATIAVLAETDFSLLDLEGNVLQRFVHADTLRALHLRRDTAWYAGDTRLYYYTPGMTTPVSLPLSGLASVIDLSADSSGLLLLGLETGGQAAVISRRTAAAAETARLSFDRFRTLPRKLLATPDGYLVAGNKSAGCPGLTCQYALGFIQRLPALALPAAPRVDLTIDRVAVTGYGMPDTIGSFDHPQLGTIYQVEIPIFLEFTFYNGGQDTVRSYALGSQRLDGFNCAEFRFYREIESTAIPPGARHTHPDIIQVRYYTGLGSFSLEGQFFVAAPNHRLDWAPENDTYAIHLISRREEPVTAPFQVSVYPNPAGELVFLKVEGTVIREVNLFDLTGRIVQQWTASPLPLNRSILPPGFYVLQVFTPLGIASRPLVLR